MGSSLETCPICGNQTTVCQGWRECTCGWSERGEAQPAPAPLPEDVLDALDFLKREFGMGHDYTKSINRHITAQARRLAELENPVTFFCVHCRAEFPASADGLKEGMEHDLTCPNNPLVRRLAEVERELNDSEEEGCATENLLIKAQTRITELDASYKAMSDACAKALNERDCYLRALRKIEAEFDEPSDGRLFANSSLMAAIAKNVLENPR